MAAFPSATTAAPVSVATSTRCVAPSFCAYQSPSPRTSRPSASVLITSTVFPDADVSTSPGFMARPPGMFSVVGTMPITLIGALSRPIARIAQMTAAPPAMSSFIRSMPSAGLIEIPPVSNVMPLPISPSTGACGAPAGLWRMTITHGGSALPRATPRSSPIPRSAISRSPRMLTAIPAAAQISAGPFGKHQGREHVRRLVAQLSRDVGRLAEDAAALDGGFELGGFFDRAGDDQRLVERGRAALGALVAIGAECGERDPFRGGLDGGDERQVAAVEPGHSLHSPLPGSERGGGCHTPEALGVEFLPLAGADKCDAACVPAADDRGHEHLVEAALELP